MSLFDFEGYEQKGLNTLRAMPRKKGPRESDIESYFNDRVKKAGGLSYKFTSPQRRAVPDRLVVIPPIFNRPEKTVFVELKAPGAKPTQAQNREHGLLRTHGATVLVIDSREGVDAFIETYMGKAHPDA